MEIRQLLPEDDRLAVSRIYAESWRHAYKGIVPQAFLDGLSEDNCGKKIDTEGRYNLVAVADGKLVGTSSYCKSRFPEYAEYGEIVSIYFLPEYMGKGYGKSFLPQRWKSFPKWDFVMCSFGYWRKITMQGHFMNAADFRQAARE